MITPGGIDASVPSPARVYDCLLGGKDHYEVDRKVAESLLEAIPTMRMVAGTPEANPQGASDAADRYSRQAPSANVTPRPRAEVERFFAGLDPVEPGLGLVTHWHAEGPVPSAEQVGLYGGVARKP